MLQTENTIEIWYADNQPAEVGMFFIALVKNLPGGPYDSINKFSFAKHEFSDRSQSKHNPIELRFDELHNSGWHLRDEEEEWILTREPKSNLSPIHVVCHNFWFHYRFKINPYSKSEFINSEKYDLILSDELLSEGVSMLCNYADEKRLLLFACDLVWDHERTEVHFDDFDGVKFLRHLAAQVGPPFALMPRFGISSFLATHTAECETLVDDGVAYCLDKTSSTIDDYLTKDAWTSFFDHGLFDYIKRLTDAEEWLRPQTEAVNHQLSGVDNDLAKLLIDNMDSIVSGLLPNHVQASMRKTDNASSEDDHLLHRLVSLNEPGKIESIAYSREQDYRILKELCERWVTNAKSEVDLVHFLAKIFAYDICLQRFDKGLAANTVCELLNFKPKEQRDRKKGASASSVTNGSKFEKSVRASLSSFLLRHYPQITADQSLQNIVTYRPRRKMK